MIGLDTNILIRFLTQDDPRQSQIANRVIEKQISDRTPGFVSIVTMVEIAWVLATRFDLTRDEQAILLDGLTRLEHIVVQHREHVLRALDELRNGSADFSDVIIGALCEDAGCSTTLTFDRRAARLESFSLAT